MASVRPQRLVIALLVLVSVALGYSVAGSRTPALRASSMEVVSLATGSAVHLATPPFLIVGKRYAFTWPGGGPPQTFVIKQKRDDGWILVEVADETIKPELYIPGEFPTRWLHVGIAVSIQEMRPIIP